MQILPIEGKEGSRTKIKNKATFSFEGELILHLIKRFHEEVCADIVEEVEEKTEELLRWCG